MAKGQTDPEEEQKHPRRLVSKESELQYSEEESSIAVIAIT